MDLFCCEKTTTSVPLAKPEYLNDRVFASINRNEEPTSRRPTGKLIEDDMNLFCCEITSVPNAKAGLDRKLLNDDRVFENLMKNEENHLTSSFLNRQENINSRMRRMVAEWMLEVCEEQNCQHEVFTLAVNYMDRFLSMCSIKRNQLQLLGTACMFIASKLREPSPLSAKDLVSYTDNSITLKDLLMFEALVLSKLEWRVICVMPQDFLRHILKKLPVEAIGIKSDMVINHAKTLIALCAIEIKFSEYLPSMIAAASIGSALCGVGWTTKSGRTISDLLTYLKEITGIEEDYLQMCMAQIDKMINAPFEADVVNYNNVQSNYNAPRPEEFTPPPITDSKLFNSKTAVTPIDVGDVHF